jgi:hypothetical protein
VPGSLALLASPAGAAALCAALLWPAATGFPTWPALARGRLASTLGVSVAVGVVVFALVQRLTAPPLT